LLSQGTINLCYAAIEGWDNYKVLGESHQMQHHVKAGSLVKQLATAGGQTIPVCAGAF